MTRELLPSEKVTAMEAPDSPETVTTPPDWVASVLEAPLDKPVPRAKVGAAGALVSSV